MSWQIQILIASYFMISDLNEYEDYKAGQSDERFSKCFRSLSGDAPFWSCSVYVSVLNCSVKCLQAHFKCYFKSYSRPFSSIKLIKWKLKLKKSTKWKYSSVHGYEQDAWNSSRSSLKHHVKYLESITGNNLSKNDSRMFPKISFDFLNCKCFHWTLQSRKIIDFK